jgi:hypothetical protein
MRSSNLGHLFAAAAKVLDENRELLPVPCNRRKSHTLANLFGHDVGACRDSNLSAVAERSANEWLGEFVSSHEWMQREVFSRVRSL